MGSIAPRKFSYEALTGFFHQDEEGTDAVNFDYKHNFGLIDRKYDSTSSGNDATLTQWQKFEQHVKALNEAGQAGTCYKVFYLGRHGEGYHNIAEAKYGTKAWEDYWAKLDGDGTLYWFDSHLSDEGKRQAHSNRGFFARQLVEAKMPAPESYYTSPLYRCLQTANLTFGDLMLPRDRSFKPVIKEMAREVMGKHTCDKRSSRTVIHETFPAWEIEKGFSEEDELWRPDHRETSGEILVRSLALLDDVFEHDEHTFISLTMHSGAIASLLNAIAHRDFRLPTGGMMSVLVKAMKRE